MKTILSFSFFLFSVQLFAQSDCRVAMGANLPVVHDWQPTIFFTDLMKECRYGFGCADAPRLYSECGPDITLTPDGWPTVPFGLVVKDPLRADDAGDYRLLFDGYASLKVFDSQVQLLSTQYDAATNSTTAMIRVGATAQNLMLGFEAPMSPVVRNIRLLPANIDPNNYPVFRPELVEHLKRFSPIRFMNWLSYWEENQVTEWADRTLPSSVTQARPSGVAYEHIVELAAAANADLWLNIPPHVSDDYVHQLAAFLKSRVSPGQIIYLEYSNEIWAPYGWQGNANYEAAKNEVLNNPSSMLNFDQSSDTLVWAFRRTVRRTKDIGDIFVDVFGQDTRNTRIRPVYAYQLVSPLYSLRHALEFLEHQYGPPERAIWGVAPAPYIGAENLPFGPITVDAVHNQIQENIQLWFDDTRFLEEAATFTNWYNLKLAMYEGGVGTFNTTPGQVSTLLAAYEHPHMRDLLYEYLERWYGFGNDNLMCWFVAGATDWQGGDFFGLSPDVGLTSSMPLQGLDSVLAHGCFEPSAGLLVPGCVDTRLDASHANNWEVFDHNTDTYSGMRERFLVRAPGDGAYTIRLIAEKNQSVPGLVSIGANGVLLDTLSVKVGLAGQKDTTAAVAVILNKGLNTLQLKYLNQNRGNYCLWVENGISTTDAPAADMQEQIFPNPVQDFLFLKTPSADRGVFSISDMAGRPVRGGRWETNQPIDVSAITPGCYVLEMQGTEKLIVYRFVKMAR